MMNTSRSKYFQYPPLLKYTWNNNKDIYIINSAIHPWNWKWLYDILELHSKSFVVVIWSNGSAVKELIKLISLPVEKKGWK